jgi:hypothetical protein
VTTVAEQTPDVEALARYLYDREGFHAADSWATESSITRGRYEALAEYVIASDWLAAREQAAEQRGAVKALRQAADSALRLRRDDYLARLYRERADQIEADS